MKILIIGAGLIGVTTAHFLKLRGHDVSVMDRQDGPGAETSFANGSLLTPSMPEPWNAPGCWRGLITSLARSNAPLQLRLHALPGLLGWGLKFLKNSNPARFEANASSNLRLARSSLQLMQSLRQKTGIKYAAIARGSLKVFRNPAALTHALIAADRLSREGLNFRRLTRNETIETEPGLAAIADQLNGGIYYGDDETGDAYRYCVALTEFARAQAVEFSFGTNVTALEVNLGRVTAVRTTEARWVADQYIVAAGSYSTPLLRPLGLQLPVQPAKGYSVTFDSIRDGSALKIPVVDDQMHAAVVPVGDAIRVAGTAEFAGYDLTLRPERVRNLIRLAQALLPRVGIEPARAKSWCGLRPMSADGVPIIGPTSISNLWLNTGHGHLGWTMAAGSGHLLAQLISGENPTIDPAPYALSRFKQ